MWTRKKKHENNKLESQYNASKRTKQKLLNGKVVKGYVHDLNLFGEFSLNFANRRTIN